MGAAVAKLRARAHRPIDDERCAELKPVWGPFVDTFVATLHAQGAAVRAPGAENKPANYREPSTSYRKPAVERLVAIGDVHGDLSKVREAFRAAGMTNEKDEWVG